MNNYSPVKEFFWDMAFIALLILVLYSAAGGS